MKNLTHLKNDSAFQESLKNFAQKHSNKTKLLEEKYNLSLVQNQKFPNKTFKKEKVWKDLTSLFKTKQGKRCSICEKELNDDYSKDIEHYRPKNHYWWLAYNPENYYLCCAECNRRYKKEQFPLRNGKKVTYTNRKDIDKEEPLLLNPMNDNPENYFQLVFIIHCATNKGIAILQPKEAIGELSKQRAEETIKVFNLDLKIYNESRFELLNKYYNDLFEIAKARMNMNKDEFFRFLAQKLNERNELRTLDLLKLIIKKQLIINTLTN